MDAGNTGCFSGDMPAAADLRGVSFLLGDEMDKSTNDVSASSSILFGVFLDRSEATAFWGDCMCVYGHLSRIDSWRSREANSNATPNSYVSQTGPGI